MHTAVVLPILLALTISVPTSGQTTPFDRLPGKIPSIFGSGPGQPKGRRPQHPPVLPGLTTVADQAGSVDAAGLELGGFRLGMSKAAIKVTYKGARRASSTSSPKSGRCRYGSIAELLSVASASGKGPLRIVGRLALLRLRCRRRRRAVGHTP